MTTTTSHSPVPTIHAGTTRRFVAMAAVCLSAFLALGASIGTGSAAEGSQPTAPTTRTSTPTATTSTTPTATPAAN